MAIGGINSLLNNYNSASNISKIAATSKMYDYKAAQATAKSYFESQKQHNATVNTLKKDTSSFLTAYTSSMAELNKNGGKLTNGGVNNLLYPKDGKITESSVKNTVSAVKDMVGSYNSSLKLLNDNAQRGPGVVNQLGRMATDPAAKETMKLAGVTANKDGTLKLDETALTKNLSDENPLNAKLTADSIDNLANGIQRDAKAGLNVPAGKLVNNDIAKMQEIKNNNSFTEMHQSIRSGGAYYMNNSAAVGLMMNMLA